MDGRAEIVSKLTGYLDQGWQMAPNWLSSPAAWSQFALLLAAWGRAVLAARKIAPKIEAFLKPKSEARGLMATGLRFLPRFVPILLPLIAVWRALKAEGIEIPYPHRVVEMRDSRGPAR